MAVTELEINGQVIPLVSQVSELENDANYQTQAQVEELINSKLEEVEYGTY